MSKFKILTKQQKEPLAGDNCLGSHRLSLLYDCTHAFTVTSTIAAVIRRASFLFTLGPQKKSV